MPSAYATTWNTAYGDVDWDGVLETVSYKTDEVNTVYPWRAPFLTADGVPRVTMGVNNLREIVYFRGERILDEGYWDGPVGGPGEHYETLYNSKDTFVDLGYIVTVWESDYAILNRTAELTSDGCTLKYEVWLKAFGYEPGPEPLADVGVRILWNAEPRAGTPEEALSYILTEIEDYHGLYANSYEGITIPELSFMINYTFDDTMKHLSNRSLMAWDGASPPDYLSNGISYEDPEFSPLETTNPALWGILHLPAPTNISVATGQFVDGVWQGVGVTGKYHQEACVKYEYAAPPVGGCIVPVDKPRLFENLLWLNTLLIATSAVITASALLTMRKKPKIKHATLKSLRDSMEGRI